MAFVWPVGARAQDSVYEHPLPAGFQETYSPGFAVVHRPEDERAAERLADYAREVRGRMKRDLGIGDPPLVTIRLAASEDDYRTLQPDGRERPEWSAGVAFPAKRIIVVYTPRGASRAGIRKDVRQILVHELAHVYLHDALGEADIPHWLQEGYARLAAGEGQITLAWELTWGWLLGDLIPLDELIHRFPSSAGRAQLAYAESASFVGYLIGQYGRIGFQTFLARVRSGQSVDRALERMTGSGPEVLEREWLTWLALHWTVLRILADSGTLWAFAGLLIVLGWWRIYLRKKRRLKEMEDEEARLYGPPPSDRDRRYIN